MIQPILSQQNPNFKRWKQILEPKGIKKFQQTIVSGRKIVPELWKQQNSSVSEVIVSSESMIQEWHLDSAKKIFLLENAHFKELDVFGTHAPLLVLNTPELAEWNENQVVDGLELILALGDPSNLGALLRSAEAFGVAKVIALKEAAHPFHPKCTKTSSGSNFRVPIVTGPSIQNLQRPEWIWALDKGGEDISSVQLPKNCRLLVGEEGQGLPDTLLAKQTLSIPMNPNVESLNAVIATSIALFLQHTR